MSEFMTLRGTTGQCTFVADSIDEAIEKVVSFDFRRWGLYIRVPEGNLFAMVDKGCWWLSINPVYWR